MATVQCGTVLIGIINSDNKNAFPLYFSHSLSPVLSRFCTSLFRCIPISIYLIRFADYICSLASFDIIYYDILLPLSHSCHVIGANNTLFDIVCGLSMVCEGGGGCLAGRGACHLNMRNTCCRCICLAFSFSRRK